VPRIRTIKPEIWSDEKLAPLDPRTRLVFIGLISLAVDAGRLVDSLRQLDGMLFPFTEDTCADSLDSLARLRRIERYRSASGQDLIQIANWDRHQRVDKPSRYTLPGPGEGASSEGLIRASGDPRETVASDSRDPIAPTPDRGSTTSDHRPPINDLQCTLTELDRVWFEQYGGHLLMNGTKQTKSGASDELATLLLAHGRPWSVVTCGTMWPVLLTSTRVSLGSVRHSAHGQPRTPYLDQDHQRRPSHSPKRSSRMRQSLRSVSDRRTTCPYRLHKLLRGQKLDSRVCHLCAEVLLR
jgi:hypothetical protein